ncbi:MAG: IscS subfamily cysteine desulfurase [Armatimonadetes bacterium]|nr:IscS subfamily cysteine desulfurase [Armatimonadota bacterium]
MNVQTPVYMDNNSTTRTDPRVVEAMLPYFSEDFGNASSKSHPFGWKAEEAVDLARERIARVLNADPKEIIFTSGATESNNLAIKGVAEMYADKGDHIITVVTEHKAILDTCKRLETEGKRVTYLDVKPDGLIDLQELADAITDKTILVSIMAANNEIGVMQPVAEIGKLCRERGVIFHTDAVQAFGKVPLDVQAMNIDIASITAHKIYGPKGIGVLYVRRRNPRIRLTAQMDGGGHERGFRSGTLNVPGIVGFGMAAKIAFEEMEAESARLTALRDKLRTLVMDSTSDVYVNGSLEHRLPGNINMSFNYVEGESLLMGLKDVALSSGSACTSASLEPSYVLKALGVGDELAHSSLRFGLGRFTTEEDVEYVAKRVNHEVERLREMSPLWELAQEGIDLSTVKWSPH